MLLFHRLDEPVDFLSQGLKPLMERVALFMTRLHARLFRPGFASLNPDPGVHGPHPLRRAMDKVNAEIDNLIERSHLKQKKAA